MVVAFGLRLGSCLVCLRSSDLCIAGSDYYTCRELSESLRVNFLHGLWISFILFTVLWDITHAAFLQLLVCKEPPCDGVEAQWISQVSWKYRELTPTRLLRPNTNFHPFLQCILHSSHVVDNAREDLFPLPQIFIPTEVHPSQLATYLYRLTPSWTPSSCMPDESNGLRRTPTCWTRSASWIQRWQHFR